MALNRTTTTTPPCGVCMNPDTLLFSCAFSSFVPHNSCVSQAEQELSSSLLERRTCSEQELFLGHSACGLQGWGENIGLLGS